MKEIICANGAFKLYFPSGNITQESFSTLMDDLYLLRCKIAHTKKYFTAIDLDKLIEETRDIAVSLDSAGVEFVDFLTELNEHPEGLVIPTPLSFSCDTPENEVLIPNNLPTPDYEYDGGFVGREDDIKKLLGLLEGNLHRVITISGAGGVGKTAIALEAVYRVLKRARQKFDGVVWLSAKETKLSYVGIEDIEPTVKSYEQLLDTIVDVMGFDQTRSTIEEREADVNTIFGLYDRILIVIDNLETITDERILNFILDAPTKSKILITSRKGLGQVERRYELAQLKEREAIVLFRLVAREKNLPGLSTLDETVIRQYVKKVSCYPLAIKWVIGQVALGKDLNAVISRMNETTSDISRFCFEQIYLTLSNDARKILCALSVFEDSPSAGILVYVLECTQQELEDGISELILVSLVIPEQRKNDQGEITSHYNLLPLTRGYVRQQLDKDSILKRDILDRLQSVQTLIESAERTRNQYRSGLANLGATTEEEKVAAMIVQTAFQKYQAGRYADAVEDYKRATSIAPRFASVYRNWAMIEAQEEHFVEADGLMGKAAALAANDPQIWLFWGNIKKK